MEEGFVTTSALRSQRQKARENRKPQLDSAQLWNILLDEDTRRPLGAAAHSFRSACPVGGVSCPPEGKVGSNHQLTEEVLAHLESIGYDTRAFPQWRWRETDRIHRWLQGARPDEHGEGASPSHSLLMGEHAALAASLREVRDRYFHSWVVACKIDTAWIPALAPFDASCPATLSLLSALEGIYWHLIPSTIAESSGGSPSPTVRCDADVLRYFLPLFIHMLYPGVGDTIAESAVGLLLEILAHAEHYSPATRERNRSRPPRAMCGSATSERSQSSSVGGHHHIILDSVMAGAEANAMHGGSSASASPLGTAASSPPGFDFAVVAIVLVVLAEPYCFNERDAANFLGSGLATVFFPSVLPLLRKAVEARDPRGASYTPKRPSPQQHGGAKDLPPVRSGSIATTSSSSLSAGLGGGPSGLSEVSFTSSMSIRDGSSMAGRGNLVRVRVRPSSWVGGLHAGSGITTSSSQHHLMQTSGGHASAGGCFSPSHGQVSFIGDGTAVVRSPTINSNSNSNTTPTINTHGHMLMGGLPLSSSSAMPALLSTAGRLLSTSHPACQGSPHAQATALGLATTGGSPVVGPVGLSPTMHASSSGGGGGLCMLPDIGPMGLGGIQQRSRSIGGQQQLQQQQVPPLAGFASHGLGSEDAALPSPHHQLRSSGAGGGSSIAVLGGGGSSTHYARSLSHAGRKPSVSFVPGQTTGYSHGGTLLGFAPPTATFSTGGAGLVTPGFGGSHSYPHHLGSFREGSVRGAGASASVVAVRDTAEGDEEYSGWFSNAHSRSESPQIVGTAGGSYR